MQEEAVVLLPITECNVAMADTPRMGICALLQ
jgi:hypothetical protein